MTLAMFSAYIYNSSSAQESDIIASEVSQMYGGAHLVNNADTIIMAACIVLFSYIMLFTVCWYCTYKGLITQINLFKLITFGMGDISKMTPKRLLFIICLGIMLAIGIPTGLFSKIVYTLYDFILSMYDKIMGVIN